jgi:hypothetical protein
MVQSVQVQSGVQAIPASQIPQQWDAGWFLNFIKTWWQAASGYNSNFNSGYLVFGGPNISTQSSINFEVGTNLPNPSGTPGPALLLGSGGGNGTAIWAWIITDEAYDAQTPGNNLGITAGETQASGTQPGGQLFLVGGGSYGGLGGLLQLQGGTSLNGNGGEAVLQGGNSTNGIPGDAYVSGGQNGTQGANVHLIMTTVNGTSGVVRIRNNSTPLIDFYPDGSIYLYKGGGFGTAGQKLTTGGAGTYAYWS